MTPDFERIGGGPAVGAVVDELYRRLITEEQQVRGSIVAQQT
jgi:hypothetical protein